MNDSASLNNSDSGTFDETTMNPSSIPPSGTSTPRGFTSQVATAEDLLKSQTVGLVNLADFRKRRADALELKEREATSGDKSGARTPNFEEDIE
jgi:hypothetical protein